MIKPGDMLVYSSPDKKLKAIAIAIEPPSCNACNLVQIKVFEIMSDWKKPIDKKKMKINFWSFDPCKIEIF